MNQKINLVELSNAIQAYKNCIAAKEQNDNTRHWANVWFEVIDKANNLLPHGSGMDNKIYFEIAECTANKLIIKFDYHHMAEGYYTHWSNYKVIITPAFGGFELNIKGRNYNDIKDYFYDMFDPLFDCPTIAQWQEQRKMQSVK